MRIVFFATLLFCACGVQAQQPALAIPKNLGKSEINPGHVRYPVELANRGVQGTTVVAGIIQTDGKLSDLKLEKSSRSETLDNNAILLVEGWHLAEGPATPTNFTITIDFTKDSLPTLKDKTCADFVADFDYFRSAFPEREAKRMPLIETTSSVLLMLQPDAFRNYLKRGEGAINFTVDQCRKNPDHQYMKTFMSALQ